MFFPVAYPDENLKVAHDPIYYSVFSLTEDDAQFSDRLSRLQPVPAVEFKELTIDEIIAVTALFTLCLIAVITWLFSLYCWT